MKGVVRRLRPLVSPRVYCLTGTPVSESPTNAYPILSVLAADRLPSRAKFDQHFVIRMPVQAGTVVINKAVAYSNLEELKRMLEAISVRRLKVDIQGMPPKTEDTRFCVATSDQADHYAEIMKGVLAQIEGDPDWANSLDIACVKLLRARQVLNHPGVLGLTGDSGKYRELDGILDEVLSDDDAKVVVWTEWNRAVDLLAERYRGYGVVTIDQRATQQDLARLEQTFDRSDVRVVVATPAKGGTGVDFLARARTAIYIEKTYSLVNHRQSIDRIVRRVADDNAADTPEAGKVKRIKRSAATVLYLHVPGSVDDVVGWVLQRKLDLGDALLTSDERLLADGKDHLIAMLRERTKL